MSMLLDCQKQFVVVDLRQRMPRRFAGEKPKEVDHLPKPHILGQVTDLGQAIQNLLLRWMNHGKRSPIFGS